MTRIALTAATLLIAAGTAFAGSDKFGPDNANRAAPAADIDKTITTSIGKSGATIQKHAYPTNIQIPNPGC